MFTLDTEILTPEGFIETWELFEGDTLVDSDNNKHVIKETIDSKEMVYSITLEDFTTFKLSKRALIEYNIAIGSDLALSAPVRFFSVEDGSTSPRLVQRQEGVDFGSYGKYEFIPQQYLLSFVENRKKFFQGLLFSQSVEKYTDDGRVYFLVGYKEFADNLVFLAKSLGGRGTYHMFYSDGEYYEVTIWLPSYFDEGKPTLKVIDIKELEAEETIKFITDQKSYVIDDFIKIEKDEDNAQEHTD